MFAIVAHAEGRLNSYGEKSFVGPADPRYFHANHATFGLRWAFSAENIEGLPPHSRELFR